MRGWPASRSSKVMALVIDAGYISRSLPNSVASISTGHAISRGLFAFSSLPFSFNQRFKAQARIAI